MAKQELKDVPLSEIRIDGGTQPRAEINQEVVTEYKLAFEIGAAFPPADVFYDGTCYWLADGFHRFHGARQSKQETLDCRVHTGTQRDAILFSVGANGIHGLRRSNADKRKAVLILLNDPEWGKWSAREIAERCAVSNNFVSEIRQTLSSDDRVEEVKFKTPTGKTSTQKLKPKTPKEDAAKTEEETPKPPSDPEADRAAAIMASQRGGKPSREPGDESETEPQALKIQRSKTIKTVEALMRAFDDLHGMQSNRLQHAEAIASCKVLLKTAKDWT